MSGKQLGSSTMGKILQGFFFSPDSWTSRAELFSCRACVGARSDASHRWWGGAAPSLHIQRHTHFLNLGFSLK